MTTLMRKRQDFPEARIAALEARFVPRFRRAVRGAVVAAREAMKDGALHAALGRGDVSAAVNAVALDAFASTLRPAFERVFLMAMAASGRVEGERLPVRKEYNPDQPRDEGGRWSEGGGGGQSFEHDVIRPGPGEVRLSFPVKDGIRAAGGNRGGFGACTQNALAAHDAKGEAVYVGTAVRMDRYEEARTLYERDGTRAGTEAFPHAWNVVDGAIVDHTLGSRDAAGYIYFGRHVPDSVLSGITSGDALAEWHAGLRKAARPPMGSTTRTPAAVTGRLDLTNPRAIAAAQKYSYDLVTDITAQTRAAIRRTIVAGQRGQLTVDRQADRIRRAIGLNEQQAVAVMNLDMGLREGGILTEGQITQRVASAVDDALDYRAEMIARTESIRASAAGQQELFYQAAENGFLGADAQRAWVASPDACGVCLDLDGVEVGLDEPWESDGEEVMLPPRHPMCRCTIAITDPGSYAPGSETLDEEG